MSDTIQENTIVETVANAIAMETPVKKTRGKKAASEVAGGAGDKPVATEKAEKPKKEKKVVPVSKTWNVPTKHHSHWDQTKFLKHIHSLIKELAPQLLEMDCIRDEFNNLIDFLSKFANTDFVTWTPGIRNRYSIYLTMDSGYDEKYSFFGSYGRWQNWSTMLSPEKEEVKNKWLTFWNLIKPAIWGPLHRAYFDTDCRSRIKNYQDTVIAIEYGLERKIAELREKAERQKIWYIDQIRHLLTHDPEYKDTV